MDSVLTAWANTAVDIFGMCPIGSLPLLQKLLIAAAGCVACSLAILLAGKGSGLRALTWTRSFWVMVTVVVLLAAIAISLRLYAEPLVSSTIRPWILPAGAIAGFFVILIPAATLLQKSNYIQSFLALSLGFGAAVLVFVLLSNALGSVGTGQKEFKKIKHRTSEVNEVIER